MMDAQNWIEDVTGEQFGGESFHDKLKNGVLLCKLINCIKPGAITKVSESRFVFKNIENVWKFCNACKEMGVPDSVLPQAPDFYEGKNVEKMVSCLHYLGGWLQTDTQIAPSFNGPYIGKKIAVASPRNFSNEQRAAQRLAAAQSGITSGSHGIMEKVDTTSSLNIGFGNKASGAGSGTATMISAGSSGIMEKVDNTSALNIGFGNKASGAGSGEATMISAGSSKIMERVGAESSYDINFGNKAAGAGSTEVTAISTGSSQVMERTGTDGTAAYDINFGNKAAGAGSSEVTAISMGSSEVMERSENVSNNVMPGGDMNGHSFFPETPSGVPEEVQQDAEDPDHSRRPSIMDRLFANSEEEKVVDPSFEYEMPETTAAADPFGDSVAMPAPVAAAEDPFAAEPVSNPFDDNAAAAAADTDPFAPSSDPFADAPAPTPEGEPGSLL